MILGGSAIILDGRMHDMLIIGQRGGDGREVDVRSKVEGFDAAPLVDGFESSAGVRPTILRVPGEHRPRELIARDGSELFWPYNILPSPDPSYCEEVRYG